MADPVPSLQGPAKVALDGRGRPVGPTRAWGAVPAGRLEGARTGVAGSAWSHEGSLPLEVSASADPTQALVCIPLTSYHCELYVDGRRTLAEQVRPGTIRIIRPGEALRAVLDGPWSFLHIYLPTGLLGRICAAADPPMGNAPPELIDPASAHDPLVERVAREMLAEMADGHPLSRLRVDVLGEELAIHLLRRHSTASGAAGAGRPARGGLAPWQVRRVADFLQENLAADVSLAELAALVGLSPHHFCRAFRQSTGLPPHRWQLARRMERAGELLLSTDLPVAAVAAAVGYADPGQFSAAFRRATGRTPSAFRRERAGSRS